VAFGDVKSGFSVAVAAAARMTIQPPSGEEWIIFSIYREANATVEFFDGTNIIPFKVLTGADELKGPFHITASLYLRVQNNDAAAKDLGYSGVQIK